MNRLVVPSVLFLMATSRIVPDRPMSGGSGREVATEARQE
jgi:hypothetical protein